jgi:hypothetical protein
MKVGLVAALMVFATACGDTDTVDDGQLLDNRLAPETTQVTLGKADSAQNVMVTVTRTAEFTSLDAKAIAQTYLQQIHLVDSPMVEDFNEDLRAFSPHIRVEGIPALEEDQLFVSEELFATQGYVCKPKIDNYYSQYIDITCIRADGD